MANPGTLPITLVTILLLVAPGYLAIRLFLRVAERNDTLDRTAKIVWSSAVSLLSLLLLYGSSPIHFEPLAGLAEIMTRQFDFVSGSDLSNGSLPTGVLLYLLHVGLLLLGALIVGGSDRFRRDDPYEKRAPWYYALADLGEENIGVLLQDGSRIDGQFVPAAWDPSTKDLVLESPERVADEGSEPLGRSILVSSDDISAVVFVDEDPDEETEAAVAPSASAVEEIEQIQAEGQTTDGVDGDENEGADGLGRVRY